MENQVMEAPRERHGFITFWLWLGIVLNIIGIIGCIIAAAELGKYSNNIANIEYIKSLVKDSGPDVNLTAIYNMIMAQMIISIFLCAGNLLANYLMLKWKKKGFYLRILTALIGVIMSFIVCGISQQFGRAILGLICTIIGIAILYAILNIRKNGKSCYGQMQ